MIKYGPPERVYVENKWYGGPRAGVADIGGEPHRFESLFDDNEASLGTFLVWPVAQEILALEIEQWRIFVEWNVAYESGLCDSDSHPGHGGLNVRWDELEALLDSSRSNVPALAKQAFAELKPLERALRYAPSGPAYTLSWNVVITSGIDGA